MYKGNLPMYFPPLPWNIKVHTQQVVQSEIDCSIKNGHRNNKRVTMIVEQGQNSWFFVYTRNNIKMRNIIHSKVSDNIIERF